MKKRAFNLSEVLTTLMVIGIIATMVLPVTISNINQQKTLAMLKKLYSSYTINIKTVLAEANCDSLSCLRAWGNEKTQKDENNVEVPIQPTEHNGVLADTRFFNIRNICTDCFTDVVLPSGIVVENTEDTNSNSTAYVLNNGAYALIHDFVGNCTNNLDSVSAILESDRTNVRFAPDLCGILILDTNGAKQPNSPSADIFGFYISDEPINGSFLIPMGLDGNKSVRNFDSVLSLIDESAENAAKGYNKAGELFMNGWSYESSNNR